VNLRGRVGTGPSTRVVSHRDAVDHGRDAIMDDPHSTAGTDNLEIAREVLRSVRKQLSTDEFTVYDATLFLSSQSPIPRAVFAVVFRGVPYGLIATEFDISNNVDTLAGELVAELRELRLRHVRSVPEKSRKILTFGFSGSQPSKSPSRAAEREAADGPDGSGTPLGEHGSGHDAVTLDRSGAWLVTTYSGAHLLVVVVIDPITRRPIATMTRYAAPGHGDEFNGAPLTITASGPPEVGERWYAEMTATDERYSAHKEIVYGGASAQYVSTPVTQIVELNYAMLAAASTP
jgi:hypothetical protein